jgi:protein-disulfide isomerase
MSRLNMRCIVIAAVAVISAAAPVRAQSVRAEIDNAIGEYLASHPEQVQSIVKDYLTKNPEVLSQVFADLMRRGSEKTAVAPSVQPEKPDRSAAIRGNTATILNSSHQVVLGNPNGKVTMVEFFDYNCGYCKRALGDMQAMIKDDPNLRVVLKEFPILGPGSVEAAQVAVAVRMQDPRGEKYFAFHQALLGGRGHADMATALAAARDAGVDVARLNQDLTSAEVKDTLTESTQLARTLGINGTPGYVIGDTIVPGAIGAAGLKERVTAASKS